MDRNSQLGQVVAREAIAHIRIIEDNVDKDRVGVIWGSELADLKLLKLKF
jgi:3-oxoacyl-[acyl-carrier-protein] synthase II